MDKLSTWSQTETKQKIYLKFYIFKIYGLIFIIYFFILEVIYEIDRNVMLTHHSSSAQLVW